MKIWASVLYSVLFLAYVGALRWRYESEVKRLRRIKKIERALKKEIMGLREEVEALKSQIKALKEEPAYIEQILREEYGWRRTAPPPRLKPKLPPGIGLPAKNLRGGQPDT